MPDIEVNKFAASPKKIRKLYGYPTFCFYLILVDIASYKDDGFKRPAFGWRPWKQYELLTTIEFLAKAHRVSKRTMSTLLNKLDTDGIIVKKNEGIGISIYLPLLKQFMEGKPVADPLAYPPASATASATASLNNSESVDNKDSCENINDATATATAYVVADPLADPLAYKSIINNLKGFQEDDDITAFFQLIRDKYLSLEITPDTFSPQDEHKLNKWLSSGVSGRIILAALVLGYQRALYSVRDKLPDDTPLDKFEKEMAKIKKIQHLGYFEKVVKELEKLDDQMYIQYLLMSQIRSNVTEEKQ